MTPQQQILDAVGARLALITVARGYHCDVRKIRRATLKPFVDEDLPAINYWPGADAQVAKGHGWVDRDLSVAIEIYDRTRDRIFTDVAMELAMDVAVSLLRSPSSPLVADEPDLTFGGLVRSAQLVTITPQIGEGQAPWCGALVSYSLSYRVSASNPLTIIPTS